MCAVTGNILNYYYEEEEKKMNILPLVIFFISGIFAIIIKKPLLKFTIPILISLSLLFNKDG